VSCTYVLEHIYTCTEQLVEPMPLKNEQPACLTHLTTSPRTRGQLQNVKNHPISYPRKPKLNLKIALKHRRIANPEGETDLTGQRPHHKNLGVINRARGHQTQNY